MSPVSQERKNWSLSSGRTQICLGGKREVRKNSAEEWLKVEGHLGSEQCSVMMRQGNQRDPIKTAVFPIRSGSDSPWDLHCPPTPHKACYANSIRSPRKGQNIMISSSTIDNIKGVMGWGGPKRPSKSLIPNTLIPWPLTSGKEWLTKDTCILSQLWPISA